MFDRNAGGTRKRRAARRAAYLVLLAATLLALGLPALTAAEITLEEPVSDLTLVLHEPVSVQLPHGVTDRTKAGTWKHQIKNINVKGKRRKPLPAGLTYCPADQRGRTDRAIRREPCSGPPEARPEEGPYPEREKVSRHSISA